MLCVGENVLLYNPIIHPLSPHSATETSQYRCQHMADPASRFPLPWCKEGAGWGGLGAGVFAECLHYYHHCHPPLPLAPSLVWYHGPVSGYTIITTTPCIYTRHTLYILGADADFMDRIINTTINNHSDQECVKWHPASCATGIDYLHCWPATRHFVNSEENSIFYYVSM